MKELDIRQAAIGAIKQIQHWSGRDLGEIEDDAKMVGGIQGFTSLNVIELVVILEEELGSSLELDIFDTNKMEKMTFKDFTNEVQKFLKKGGK